MRERSIARVCEGEPIDLCVDVAAAIGSGRLTIALWNERSVRSNSCDRDAVYCSQTTAQKRSRLPVGARWLG
jgi:hypothetical protein